MPQTYREKTTIEAVQLRPDTLAEIEAWIPQGAASSLGNAVLVNVEDGTMLAQLGDFIVCRKGRFGVLPPGIFTDLYEAVD